MKEQSKEIKNKIEEELICSMEHKDKQDYQNKRNREKYHLKYGQGGNLKDHIKCDIDYWWEDYAKICCICGKNLKDFSKNQLYCKNKLCCKKNKSCNDSHIDHQIPRNFGGNNNIMNLQPLCECCNEEKSDKIPKYITFASRVYKQIKQNGVKLTGFKLSDLKPKSENSNLCELSCSNWFCCYKRKGIIKNDNLSEELKNILNKYKIFRKQTNIFAILTKDRKNIEEIKIESYLTYSTDNEKAVYQTNGHWNLVPINQDQEVLSEILSCEEMVKQDK